MNAAELVATLAVFARGCEAGYESICEADEAVPDVDTLVRLLAALRDCRADLARFYDALETDLLALSGEKRFVVDGLGEVQIRKSVRRTAWDNHSLTAVLVARALDERVADPETGEFEAAHEAVARVLSECARPSWRVTPIRARGIDETEYCTVDEASWGVQLPPRADQ